MSTQEEEIAEEMTPDPLDQPDDPEQGDETEAEQGDETEAEAAAPATRSQNEIEALTKKLEAEGARHSKRVAQIMGDDFALLVPSPVDWTPGFLFNVPEMLPQPEQVAQLDALLGRDEGGDLLDAEDAQACDKCNARGQTKTGSRVDGQRTKPCGKCNGTGWVVRLAAVPQYTQIDYTANAATGHVPTPETYQVKDSWGRPAGHPHFGIDPVAITA